MENIKETIVPSKIGETSRYLNIMKALSYQRRDLIFRRNELSLLKKKLSEERNVSEYFNYGLEKQIGMKEHMIGILSLTIKLNKGLLSLRDIYR